MSMHHPSDQRVEAHFFRYTRTPTQVHMDGLLVRRGVPLQALVDDPDGGGFPIRVAGVERSGRRFEFVEEGGTPAIIIVARDAYGEPADMVAWAPREGWSAPWWGGLPLLGLPNLSLPAMGEPVPVFLDVLPWMQAGREGVVILDRKTAWRALEGVTVMAENIPAGLTLRKLLTPPEPKIMVPSQAAEGLAA